jgi:hypothetical protein
MQQATGAHDVVWCLDAGWDPEQHHSNRRGSIDGPKGWGNEWSGLNFGPQTTSGNGMGHDGSIWADIEHDIGRTGPTRLATLNIIRATAGDQWWVRIHVLVRTHTFSWGPRSRAQYGPS